MRRAICLGEGKRAAGVATGSLILGVPMSGHAARKRVREPHQTREGVRHALDCYLFLRALSTRKLPASSAMAAPPPPISTSGTAAGPLAKSAEATANERMKGTTTFTQKSPIIAK